MWCKHAQRNHHVVIGHSWGSLSKSQIFKWDRVNCNELLAIGKRLPCSHRWAWPFFSDWLGQSEEGQGAGRKVGAVQRAVEGVSSVTCAVNFKASSFCKLNNVRMDFSKMVQSGLTRSFSSGFVTTFGRKLPDASMPSIPGLTHLSTDISFSFESDAQCDIVESRPSFVLSNDDIFNLGHYSNDLMNVWNMLVLANADSTQSLLINIDGYRVGGPAGGPAHRMMVPEQPDSHGPYVGYYESWFNEVKKAVDYSGKRVCFTGGLFLPPDPGVAWFWNDWGQVNDCSLKAASPLYQSFNLFLRQRWLDHFGPQSLIYPAEVYTDYATVLSDRMGGRASPRDGEEVKNVHVVIEVRTINPKKTNNHSSARHISNLKELVRALRAISISGIRVTVTAQDFAQLTFPEQVRLAHSASVLLSMHGAGTTHIFHSALGSPQCCALIELFPDHTIEFFSAQGYGNIARMLGLHHYRYEAAMGSTTPRGTAVEVSALAQLVTTAVRDVTEQATCVHNGKDTSCPIHPSPTLT
eukprot:CAMPEP_0170068466 /NCGR_PEP_ID=MMETSP0019_2-20121128/7433_1 /TAXON_ID=98059 /ORGANISM="Dinobryon sp., Strain UTEXLB2267" /LENGTH=522 /DNA_ID=CAMNT_0010276123 /DNA_START=338 /DNA_END=1906 /DNA_ORIENTATION=+